MRMMMMRGLFPNRVLYILHVQTDLAFTFTYFVQYFRLGSLAKVDTGLRPGRAGRREPGT